MRVGYRLFLALCAASMASAMPARAQTGPVVVIPGKAGVPVIIDGVIADGAIVYGDWGLARPGHGELVIEGPVAFAVPWDERGYYPKTGHKPRVGRLEIDSQKIRPRPTSFRRDWSAASEFRAPVTQYPPFDPPPVILAPRERRR
jgi:hypothetical protein